MRLLLFALSVLLPTAVRGAEIIYGPDIDLTFTWGYDYTPDCVKRQPLVEVNGFWPPPTIRVKAKEKITLKAHNKLVAVAFTIHLHGFNQTGTPWADGTSMIATCPIPPDTDSSTQVFYAPDQPGTYIYHGHVAHAKVAGFTGMLLVDENPAEDVYYDRDVYTHDEELDLMVADSFHAPSLPALAGLLQKPFRWVGDPQTILINGQSYFSCEDNDIYTCDNFNDTLCMLSGITSDNICGAGQVVYYNNLVHCDEAYCQPRTTLDVVSDTTYLLHIANGGVSAMLNTAIENHTMTVVEVDGMPCKPQEVVFLDLHVGQRAGVLITTNQPEGAYWISSIVRGREAVRTGGALLVYNNVGHNLDGQAGEDDPARLALEESQPAWNDWEFMRLQQQLFESLVPETMPTLEAVDRTFVFLNTQERFEANQVNNYPTGRDDSGIGIGEEQERPQCKCDDGDGFLKWAVDRKTFVNPTTPLLHSMYFETNEKSEEELEDEGFYKLHESEVYDIVLQNFPACNGACEVHPWHLHGHQFWHVGTFEGAYDPSVGYAEEEAGNNYRRDTILLVGADSQNTDPTCSKSTLEPCGYTVIRFQADNPGAWFFHCHIDWHLVMGMAVGFYYDDLPNTAPEPDLSVYDICGDIYPQVVVDKVLGKKKSMNKGRKKSMSKSKDQKKRKNKGSKKSVKEKAKAGKERKNKTRDLRPVKKQAS